MRNAFSFDGHATEGVYFEAINNFTKYKPDMSYVTFRCLFFRFRKTISNLKIIYVFNIYMYILIINMYFKFQRYL